MANRANKGSVIRYDPTAQSASLNEPGFIARPADAPAYHGFTILETSFTDGWRLGIITDLNDPQACEELDGFVIAPDGSRAGLVWDKGVSEISVVCEASQKRWGVFSVPLSAPVHNDEELISEFRRLLPKLIELKSSTERDRGSKNPKRTTRM